MVAIIDGSVAIRWSYWAVLVLWLGGVVGGLMGVVGGLRGVVGGLRSVVHWGRLVIDGLRVVVWLCVCVSLCMNGSAGVTTIVGDVGWQGA